MVSPVIQRILDVFKQRGSESYGSEAVSQLQHAIQAAVLAQRDGANNTLIVAALLHDIGHILGDSPLPESHDENFDDKHETRAFAWLLENFGPQVADPVRLHVAAKRYLCTTDPTYCDILSPTSLKSFYDQGGMMSDAERVAFEGERFYRESLRLRRWDDEAKDPSMPMPEIDFFVGPLEQALAAR